MGMRIEAQAPIIGSAFVGGMAQSFLVRRYPRWSWILSIGMIGGGAFLATKPGWMEPAGLGVAASGASGLGVGLMPVGGEGAAGRLGSVRQLSSGVGATREAAARTVRASVLEF